MKRQMRMFLIAFTLPSAALAQSNGALRAELTSSKVETQRSCFSFKAQLNAWTRGGIEIPSVCQAGASWD